MALKVIGAGFGRTGTWSTFAALNRLGFPCYHSHRLLAQGGEQQARHTARLGPGVRNYTATVDNPGCCVWRELLAIGLSFAGVVAVLGGLLVAGIAARR